MSNTKKDRNDTELSLHEKTRRLREKDSKKLRSRLQSIQHDSRSPEEIMDDARDIEDWL